MFQSSNNKYDVSLQLNGSLIMYVYQGETYRESGYSIIKKNEDNNNYYVNIISDLNIDVLGNYTIKYQLLYNKKVLDEAKRVVSVIDNPISDVRINLKGSSVVYVWLNDTFVDEGVTAFNNNVDISSQTKVLGTVNSNQVGTYELEYYIELNGIRKSVKRTVNVLNLSIDENINYEESRIEIKVNSDDFHYIELPNGGIDYGKSITYPINKNDKYEFVIYTKFGLSKKHVVNVEDYDKNPPTGSCIATISNNKTNVIVTANDDNKVVKYVYNNQVFYDNTITINSEIINVTIKVYDSFDNYSDIKCNAKRIFDNNMDKIIRATTITPCNNNWTNYNNELDAKIREFGYRTRDAVAYAADYLAKFDYMVAYSWGGKYLQKGINPSWGCETTVTKEVCSKSVGSFKCIYGMDCTGYTSWAFIQAGFPSNILRTSSQSTGNWGGFNAKSYKYSFANSQDKVDLIKPGDIVHTEGHVGIVIGTSNDLLKVANMHDGIRISYINKSNGRSTNGDKSFDNFVLFDKFFEMYGA